MWMMLRKSVAIMLVAWAALDMAVPALCLSDSGQVPEMKLIAEANAGSAVLQPASPQGNDPAPRFSYEDDCFCCCAHIVPSPQQQVLVIFRVRPTDVNLPQSHPIGDPPTLYHPPRS